MTGVEAAASLFGSEDSGSDLFATLGGDTPSPQPPAADFFSNTSTSLETEAYAFNSSAESYLPDAPTFLGESAQAKDSLLYGQPENSVNQGEWGEQQRTRVGQYSAAPTAHPVEAKTDTNHDNYAPSTYSNDVHAHSSYGEYSQPVQHSVLATTYPNYGTYDHTPTTTSHSSYSAYDPPTPLAPPTRSIYDTYSPPTSVPTTTHSIYGTYDHSASRATTTTSYGAYDPLVPASHNGTYNHPNSQTTTKSAYGAYDPPIPASHNATYDSQSATKSAYGAYDPPPPTSYYKPESSGNTYSNPSYALPAAAPPTVPVSQYGGITSVPPPPTTKSTITRPKVSNAYDPPFPTTLSARRGARPGLTQQLQAQYQNPAESYYATPIEASSAYSSPPYKPPALLHEHSSQLSTQVLSNGYSEGIDLSNPSGEQYTRAESPEVPPPAAKRLSDYTASYNAEQHQDNLSNHEGQIFAADEMPQDNVAHNNIHGNNSEVPESHIPIEPPSASQPPPTDVSSASPQPDYISTTNTSPSFIPLPHSPLLEDTQDAECGPFAHFDPPSKLSSYQKSYSLQHGLKKDTPMSKDVYDPYAPKTNHHTPSNYIPRTSSPLSLYNGRQADIRKPSGGAPPNSNNTSSPSYGSIPKPLIPASLHRNPNLPTEDHVSRQGAGWGDAKLGPQDILVRATATQYAPSPSLIGANDPLSRTSARAPVITFGFGGKIVTCFHGMPGLNAGFDVAFSSRTSSELKIRTLNKLLPESTPTASYPGPLLSDPGTTSISLVRQNAATQTRTKKTAVLGYLSDRITELHQGLGYLTNLEKQTADNKLILVKLLKIMVESDGRFLGTPQSEAAVRLALVPRLDGTPALQDAVSIQASYKSPSLDELPISVTTLRPSTLDKIEELLLQGDRRQAYQFAMNEKLWAHAMVIASSIDKDSWKEVVHDFLRAELGTREDGSFALSKGNISQTPSQQTTRESLRVAYSLFSGSGAAAVQELVSQNLLHRGLGRLQPPMLPGATPRTPNFMPMPPPNMLPSIPSESLGKWAETAAMMISSPLTAESSAALTSLGDQLLANNLVEAAHSCYLLSPQTSLVGGLGSPSARIILVGCKNPADATRNEDALIFSEILEFALSLVPTVKGQEPFHGISHLQAYRFIRAIETAEHGDLQLANRYCDAITACLTHSPSYTNIALLEQLQGLQQRLSGVFHGDKSNSWIGGKLSKPSLDSIGGWLEGRFTKLVTGESESETAAADNSKTSDHPFIGPFAHYSTISSTTPSARSSPQPPSAGLNTLPPQRTSSAMATATPYSQQYQVERSSSAMGYMRQRPGVQTNASSSNSLASSQSSPVGFGLANHPHDQTFYTPNSQSAQMDEELETPVQGSSWWKSQETNGSNNTPTNATFMKVDESSITAGSDGLISLIESHSFSVGPAKHQQSSLSKNNYEEDDNDDLGLGNSKPKPAKEELDTVAEDAASASSQAAPAAAEKPEAAAATGGSWLGRWWKRSDSTTPAPIKASLGEESAFYYDNEQKRWVNRKAGAEEAPKPAAPPPPPSRAQTASPGMTGPKPIPHAGPPLRSASAVDFGEPPMKVPMRIRSNLAPPTESAPSTPTGTRMDPSGPPPARPRSQAAKRNIRSRYVDVFQQEGGGS